MSGKGDFLQTVVLKLAFQNVSSTSTTTSLFVALHTADPTNAGNQSSNEIAYTSYARVATARSAAGWTVSGNDPASAFPAATITFTQCTTASTVVATFWSVGDAASGAGNIWYSGAISPTIALGANVTPQLSTASACTED